MIFPETKIFISDNSGGIIGRCIKPLKCSKSKGARLGDLIVLSLRKIRSYKQLKKGNICYGLIIRLKKNIQRSSGCSIKFKSNALILLNDKYLPLSTRIYGPVSREICKEKYTKITSMSRIII